MTTAERSGHSGSGLRGKVTFSVTVGQATVPKRGRKATFHKGRSEDQGGTADIREGEGTREKGQ